MPGYLLDTNVLISWFGKKKEFAMVRELKERPDNSFHTSIICVAEFMTGSSSLDARILRDILERGEIEMIPFEGMSQVEWVARFRKTIGLKIPDAIIAAAAKDRNLILLTFDKVFARKVATEILVHKY